MAATAYVERHEGIVKYVHWCLRKNLGVPELALTWFNHKLTGPGFVEKGTTQIYWKLPVTIDHLITANKLDTVVVDHQYKLTILIDMSVLGDWNVVTKKADKLEKYSELRTEIHHIWGTEVKTVPVVIGALATVKKSLTMFLELTSPNARVEIIQREAILSTLHYLCRVLDIH